MNFIDAMTAVTPESTVRRTELEPTSPRQCRRRWFNWRPSRRHVIGEK